MNLLGLGRVALVAVVAVVGWSNAREFVRAWIRDQIRARLWKSLVSAGAQLLLLLGAYALVQHDAHSLGSLVVASALLWGITVFNTMKLFRKTIPELLEVRRDLQGLRGYLLRDILKVSLVEEMLQLDLVLLGLCIALATVSRWELQEVFQYIEPWRQLLG